ncbi:MAG: nucleotide-diphospho-sugar transferase [Cyanobacteria bacterium P01_H01_bin.74]
MTQSPVLVIIFNRAESALKVIDALRLVKPERVYINADGPRPHKAGEAELCTETRKAVVNAIDWPCDIKTRFLDENRGCGKATSSGISWFFETEEQGIIFDDDCVPHPDFFKFCDEILETYKDDTRVMHVSGNNFMRGQKVGDASFYWSNHALVWGWATWKRAWQHFDINYRDFETFIANNEISNLFDDFIIRQYRLYHWKKLHKQRLTKPTSWAFAWSYAVYTNSGLCANPNVNLVTNVGFGENATHQRLSSDPDSNLPTQSIGQISHPTHMVPAKNADRFVLKNHNLYSLKGIFWKVFYKAALSLKPLIRAS